MMKKIIHRTVSLFEKKQTSIFSAATVIMTTVAASRFLGLLRVRMLTDRFTADELGVYFAAFRLPNLLFELIVMGALTSAFIPVFTTYMAKDNKEHAFRLAASVINIALIIFAILSLLILFFTKELAYFIAPGFTKEELGLLVVFTRIMLVAQVFPLIIGNFLTGMLQSHKNFLIPALAPVAYNVGIIIGIIVLSPVLGMYGPVIGVVFGAFLFMVIQIPSIMGLGYRHRPAVDVHDGGVREVGRLMLPRTAGLAVSQVDSTVDLMLCSLLGARSVTVFNLAQQLQQVPIGLFGASLAQAALPTLAELRAHKNLDEFKKAFLATFHQILFLTLPAGVLLVVLRIPIVRLVFGASRFDWPATVLTGKTLAFFSLSLFAQAQIQLLARAFYSLYDSKTPVVIGGIAVIINTVLSIVFVRSMGLPVWSLGLSTSVSALFNVLALLYYLDRSVNTFNRSQLLVPSIKMFTASLVMGIALYVPMKLLDQLVFDTTRTFNLFLLTGVASLSGLMMYLFLAWFFNIREVVLFFNFARKIMRVRQPILETSAEVINGESGRM